MRSYANPALPHRADTTLKFQTLALCVYVGMFMAVWLLSSYLPEQFFRDQVKLVDSLGMDAEDLSSFRASALTYSYLTFGHPEWLVPVCGIAYAALLAQFTLRSSLMFAAFLLFVPSLMLNLVVLGKETMVIGLSALIVVGRLRTERQKMAWVFAILLYVLYGSFVRPYFLGIIGLFIVLVAARQLSFNGRVMLGIAALVGFCLLPSQLYSLAAEHRDTANNYAMFRGGFDIRTMVHNVVMPTNAVEFILNYVYSLLVLNFPLAFFFGPRDALITLTNMLVLLLIWKGLTRGNATQRSLGLLMLSHMLILCLFEPDVGSYSRHLLSVSLYAAVSLALLPRLRFAT